MKADRNDWWPVIAGRREKLAFFTFCFLSSGLIGLRPGVRVYPGR